MNEKHICPHCGEEYDEYVMTQTADGTWVCPDCLDEHYEQCSHCGEWFPMSDCVLTPVNGGDEYFCEDCLDSVAYQCEDCGEWFTRRNMWTTEPTHNRNICNDCSDNWRICNDCGAVIREDDAYYCDADDACYCEDCYDRHSSTGAIHDYGYKPYPVICRRKGESDRVLTFGVELEVDGGDDPDETAQDVTDGADDRVYCKHDGSLDEGFEIVSHPGSLAHHMYEMRWANICRICDRAGFKSHDTSTCGLHIHVGRDQLGDWSTHDGIIANLVVLVSSLREPITTFTRRSPDKLAQWARIPELCLDRDLRSLADIRDSALGTRYDGRYQAVNLQNDATVEFRIFRGTLNRDTIIASLQLVNNLCQYAMEHTLAECLDASFADIVFASSWKELTAYCAGKGLVPAPVEAQPA